MGLSTPTWPHLLPLSALLLLAHLSPTLCTCRTGRQDECLEALFVPGHDLVGEGFDIVKMQHKRTYTIDVQSYLRTDSTCQMCVNDKMGNKFQKLPLSVVNWRSSSNCRHFLTSKIYESASELVKSTNSQIKNDWSLGLDLEGLGVEVEMGSSSVAKFAYQLAKEDLYAFTIHEFNCPYYSFRVSNTASPNREFAQDISRLPKEYNDATKQRYKQLINTYGTHYLGQVELGGRMRTVSAIRTCLISLNGQTSVEIKDCLTAQLSLTLGFIDPISANAEVCSTVLNSIGGHATSSYKSVHQMTEMVPGGVWIGSLSSTFNDSSGFHTWMDQLKENPGVVSYSLNPLPMLISDEVIKGNVKSAIQDYLKENAISSNSNILSCTSDNCCPKETHRGKLRINLRARDLYGDWWSVTDAFATVQYGDVKITTRVVYSDNPVWNVLDFGDVDTMNPFLYVNVYDEDLIRNEWLGSVNFWLAAGSDTITKYFGSSSVTISYTLTCNNHLTGDLCDQYTPAHPDQPPLSL